MNNQEQKDESYRLIQDTSQERQFYEVSFLGGTHKISKESMDNEIERLIDDYGNDVLRVAYMYLKDKQRAEDAFQEVFLKVYKKYHSFKGNSSEKTWIIRIAINVCKDMKRGFWLKRVFMGFKEEKSKVATYEIEHKVIEKAENKQLFEEVMNLSSHHKEIILLYYYQELDTKEISKMLHIAEGTVRSRLHRAREILKTRIVGREEVHE